MLSTLRKIGGTDVDDGTTDGFGRGDDDVVVFGDLKGVEGAFRGGLVEDSFVDGVGDRVVDEFAEDETVCAGEVRGWDVVSFQEGVRLE